MARRKVVSARPVASVYIVVFRPKLREWSKASVAFSGTLAACQEFLAGHRDDRHFYVSKYAGHTAEEALSNELNMLDALPPFLRW